jgi:hypothetical protein
VRQIAERIATRWERQLDEQTQDHDVQAPELLDHEALARSRDFAAGTLQT